jgi:hypothetical protein
MNNPFTVNVLRGDDIVTEVFANAGAAILYGMDAQNDHRVVHVTVTDEDTGADIYDEAGVSFT